VRDSSAVSEKVALAEYVGRCVWSSVAIGDCENVSGAERLAVWLRLAQADSETRLFVGDSAPDISDEEDLDDCGDDVASPPVDDALNEDEKVTDRLASAVDDASTLGVGATERLALGEPLGEWLAESAGELLAGSEMVRKLDEVAVTESVVVAFGDSDGDSDGFADIESVGDVDPLLLGSGDFDRAAEIDTVREKVVV
jgi:hypothetical protein